MRRRVASWPKRLTATEWLFLVLVAVCAATIGVISITLSRETARLNAQVAQSRLGLRFTYCDGVLLLGLVRHRRLRDPRCTGAPVTPFRVFARAHGLGG